MWDLASFINCIEFKNTHGLILFLNLGGMAFSTQNNRFPHDSFGKMYQDGRDKIKKCQLSLSKQNSTGFFAHISAYDTHMKPFLPAARRHGHGEL